MSPVPREPGRSARSGGAPSPDVVALLTAYHPDARLADVVAGALTQVGRVVVVDNTPTGPGAAEVLDAVRSGAAPGAVEVHRTGSNAGLAAALNAGVRHAGEPELLLLLDQDSVLEPGTVTRLRPHLADADVAAVVPAPWDASTQRYLDPRAHRRPEVVEVATAITSGMLLRRSSLVAVGPFREDFFVDLVDLDLCLRLRARGWRIVQDRSVLLPHSLGETRWHGRGPFRLRATHHPTWRLYWIARNSVVLLREHAWRQPVWAVTWCAILAYWAVTIAAFEPPRGARLRLFARGLVDGSRGRTGPGMRPA